MFNCTKAKLTEKAKEYNFVRDTLEKVLRLIDVLSYLNANSVIKEKLALKGGTAINLTVFNLPRLSIDIDLDFCGYDERDEMMEQRVIISNIIKTHMQSQGYTLSTKSKNFHTLDSFVFTYKNLGGVTDNIKIEINYSLRIHIFEPKKRMMLTDIVDNILINTLEPVEIFASKINALLDRTAARDLYDVHNMIKSGLFDSGKEMLRKCAVMYTAISQDTIPDKYDIDRIDNVTMRIIKTDLLPVIKRNEFIDLIKIKDDVKNYLTELLVLSDGEKEFLQLFKEKQFESQLIFDDPQIIDRLNKHPMIMWKLQTHERG
jgi:predicted nucleotidyltransferase component of viral defense system